MTLDPRIDGILDEVQVSQKTQTAQTRQMPERAWEEIRSDLEIEEPGTEVR